MTGQAPLVAIIDDRRTASAMLAAAALIARILSASITVVRPRPEVDPDPCHRKKC